MPTPVTGTVVLVAFAIKLTVAGTVATVVSLELRFIAKPPGGAGTERFNVKFCVAVPTMLSWLGKKLAIPVTCTVWLTVG